jgi:hypothetical protein
MKTKSYIQTTRDISRILLTILVAPLAISFVADLLKGRAPAFTQAQIWLAAILALLYILLAILAFTTWLDSGVAALSRRARRRAYKRPRVLILDGTLTHDHEIPARAVHSVYTPQEWSSALTTRHPSWNIQLAPLNAPQLRRFQVLLNPFGEVYPEADPKGYSSFSEICDYVYGGGVYVNVAGIPFWYSHDPRNPIFATKVIHAGYIQREIKDDRELLTMRSLFHNLFPQLGELTEPFAVTPHQTDSDRTRFGDIAAAGGTTNITVFRAYKPQTPGMIPLLRSPGPDMWIIGALKYGDGAFLVAGVSMADRKEPTFDKILAAIGGWVHYEAAGKP